MAATDALQQAPVEIPGFRLVERLHSSAPRVVYRAVRLADGRDAILKTLAGPYPSARDVAELRHEFHVAQKLGIDGVIRVHGLVPHGVGNVAIEMEPFGLSLAALMEQREGRPLPLDRFLDIACRLARILGQMHELDVVHKDVMPRNVLIDPATDELRLIDFGISSELTREHQSTFLSKRLEGSLPYISPEQTGRMNRALDYRSDYYSLGVTFFELLTGRLPFAADTALEWVHRHISQAPPAAHEVDAAVPEALSRIVSKLMAKDVEDRYQSTFGLIADLERCREALAGTGRVPPFDPGESDISRKFQVPQRLYGRGPELERLESTLADVAGGSTALCLVSGYSGVGKSALVNELGQSIVRLKGYLIQGKFDQFQQNSAYGGLALALRDLVQQLLGESAERLDTWRQAFQTALGPNARLMLDLVPELRLVIGDQPPVPELPPTEAQNRLQIVLLNFVKVFAALDHALVIFMDDLQWSDVPTLNLIERLVTARDLSHVLVIGAYRSNAADASHPLQLTLNQIRKLREPVEIRLEPLDRDAVDELITDTLHCGRQRARSLGERIHEKTRGNPFFIGELLKSLKEQRAIVFDPEAGRWDWDTDAVGRAEVAENVVDFMIANLRRLPAATQQMLQLAACIGNSFDLGTLSIISAQSMDRTSAALEEALRRDMVVPLSDSYKYVGLDHPNGTGSTPAPNDVAADGLNPTYRFQHDRIQQAAYALIEPGRRQEVHLSIGRLIQRHSPGEERLMDIVVHLNQGRPLIDAPRERHSLARLNLLAGLKAQRASAYQSALDFFWTGQELLGGQPWESDYALMLQLSREYQQCAYLTADYAEADAWTEIMLRQARTPLEKAEILAARTRQYATMGRMRESIQAAIAGLALLGVGLTETPGPDRIAEELNQVEKNLRGRRIEDLIQAPPLSDPGGGVAIRLLMEIFPAAFLSGSGDLFPYLVLKSVNLSLQHGNSPESAFAYAAFGMLLCGSLHDPALGYEYGKLAVAMNERFEDITLKSRIIYVYAMFIHHWSNHWSSMTPWFLKGIEAGYQSGDLLYLAYSAQDCIIWDPTLDLETASREQRRYLAIVRDCEYQDSLDSGTLFLQMQLNFQGLTDGQYSMNDESFDEARCVEGMQRRRFMTGVANYQIYKAEIHFFYEDYAGALEHVRAQDRMIASSMSLPQLVRYYIVAFLTRAALYEGLGPAEQAATLERLRADLQQMSIWARNCPENFEHLRLTMEAELARLAGRFPEALRFYEEAIRAAGASGFRRDEAVANELAARYLIGLGLTKAAEGYLRAAAYLYYRWGARRKVEDLERRYPQLLATQASTGGRDTSRDTLTSTTSKVDTAALDMSSVMKASRAISREIVVGQLWKTTIQILLENAGGQMACLVVRRDDQLWIQAQGEAGQDLPPLDSPLPVLEQGQEPRLPVSVINSVLRTGTPLVLTDANASIRFAADTYIASHRPQSVMCIPIRSQDRFDSAIYMENNLSTCVFTEERVEVVKLLSAQAAISLENARLYEDQLRLTQAQQRFVPSQFLESLGHSDIARVRLGEHVAKDMSVMFCDLRNFTPLAERLGPRAVIELLNQYFSRLAEPIARAHGFIDSYNGDEIMALFDGPADAAVRAGVEMHRALEAFNREHLAAGQPTLQMGVGANTGPLVLGTVGGQDRLQCSVVGDTVNTASRIEQLTKLYRAPFLIGQNTFEGLQAADSFSIRMIDRVAVKGKKGAIELYEVLDAETPERRAAKEATRAGLARAMECYFARGFEEAHALFRALRSLDPEDAVLSLFSERAARYAEEPPPPTWQGVERLMFK
jgi:predicted ATPase/class 3 adenylate cyclase